MFHQSIFVCSAVICCLSTEQGKSKKAAKKEAKEAAKAARKEEKKATTVIRTFKPIVQHMLFVTSFFL